MSRKCCLERRRRCDRARGRPRASSLRATRRPAPRPCARMGMRRADARDHVLALRVGEPLAVELLLARRRVAREGDARGARVARGCRRPSPARCRRCPSRRGCRACGGRRRRGGCSTSAKTASMACQSCSRGSLGKSRPVSFFTMALNARTIFSSQRSARPAQGGCEKSRKYAPAASRMPREKIWKRRGSANEPVQSLELRAECVHRVVPLDSLNAPRRIFLQGF